MATKAKNATAKRAQTKAAPQAEAAPKTPSKMGRKPKPKTTREEAQRRARASLDPRVKLTANVLPENPNPDYPAKKGNWRDSIPQQAREFALLGITNKEMAAHFGVDESTFYKWMKAHPELQDALDGGRDGANAKVAASLYQRAVGFTETIQDIKIIAGEPQVVEYKRYFPPEVQAQIFWLKNRRPDLWRDKVENALIGAPAGELTPRIVVEHIKSAMKEAERDAGGQ